MRQYELDSFGHVNNAVYVNYMQEAAIEASADAGFGPAWYMERSTSWVIRKLSVRYLLPARYKDELEIETWVSNVRRATSTREYVITRTEDGARVVRARAQWVYLNSNTGQVSRLPPEIAERFVPTNEHEELGIRLQNPQPTTDAYCYQSLRRVQTYELDMLGHVNHAVYLNWVEQAYFDALRAAGHAIEQTRREGWLVVQGGHDIEYFEPAFDNDEIEITSWVCELGRVRGAWTHEIRSLNREGRLLAREYSLGIFVNEAGKPIPAPTQVINDVVRGPK